MIDEAAVSQVVTPNGHQVGLGAPAKASSPTKAVFIVGVSRSGTTLMRRVLNASEQVAICSENHFLGHLLPAEGARFKFRQWGDLRDDDNVHRLVEYIYGGAFASDSRWRDISTQWHWIIRHVPREEFLRRILATDRSERALFTVMMQVFAARKGKSIIGEKTPAHIRYVPTLLDWFPEGRIIHMLRDPRAVFVSEFRRRQRRPFSWLYRLLGRVPLLLKLFILFQVTLVWAESVRLYHRYQKRYANNYYLLRFEDLVTEPQTAIAGACDFLGIPMQDAMFKQVFVVSEGFRKGEKGFDSGAAHRWRNQIDPWAERWFVFWFGQYLEEFGYLRDGQRRGALGRRFARLLRWSGQWRGGEG